MNPNAIELIAGYRDKGVLIDTNLLLVLLVGNINPRWVGKLGKTEKYNTEDYEKIRDALAQFRCFITTPQVLTETGNLLKRNCPNTNTFLDLSLELRRFVFSKATRETRGLSMRIMDHPAFVDFGYADAAILHAAAGKYLVFTDDGPLFNRAYSCGVDVLPFDWLRRN